MDRLLWTPHWKNPEMLEKLHLARHDRVENCWEARYHQELGQNDRLKRPALFNGWIIPTGEPTSPDDQQFLNTLFMAAQGFTRLGTLAIDYVVYTKARH
jgi:hypothetical protein